MPSTRTIVVSDGTVVRAILYVGLALVIFAAREVLVAVFVALVLAAALDPTITRMERAGMPRGTAAVVLLLFAFSSLWLLGKLVVPLVVVEGGQFVRTLVDFTQRGFEVMQTSPNPQIRSAAQQILRTSPEGIAALSENVFAGALNVFSGAFGLVGIVVLTVYGAVHQRDLMRLLLAFVPQPSRGEAFRLFQGIRDRLGLWLRGQLLLGAIIFAMTYVGLLLLDVRFALVLALIAGVTEWVPVVGPLIGAVPAVLVAVSQYPMLGIWVLLLYLVVQQLENYLIVPRVMAQATGLNPLLVIVAILVGANLAGIVGIFLAVPLAIMVSTWLEFRLERNAREEALRAAAAVLVGRPEQAIPAAAESQVQAQAAAIVAETELLHQRRTGS